MELDPDNKEFNLAVNFVENSNKNIFLTGKAGTGKTTFLRYIKDNVDKNIVIVAPTGIAAINAGGVTIHSFFQIGFGVFPPDDKRLRTKAAQGDKDQSTIYNHFKFHESKRELLQKMDMLIIDEVSMVRCDILDTIDKLLRVFGRKNRRDLPFGGIQTIVIGDAFQLPPVAKRDERSILDMYYKNTFFFDAKVFNHAGFIPIELQKIYRQSDPHFISLLNKVREGNIYDEDVKELNRRVYWDGELFEQEIMLSTHNSSVRTVNADKLRDIEEPLYTYKAEVNGSFKDGEMPTDYLLKLKVGAQIIFVKNELGPERRYFNGKVAKIVTLTDKEIEVELGKDNRIWVEKSLWEKFEYEWDEENKTVKQKLMGTFRQFPIKLAWAITIHKSQGLTFENVLLDMAKAFENGQVYVGLSRCTSLKGVRMKSKIYRSSIKTSRAVIEFNKQMNNFNAGNNTLS